MTQLADRLAAVVRARSGEAKVRVENLTRLSGGASRETWSFDLLHDDGRREPLVLRRDPPGAPRAGMSREAAAMRAAASAGVPVPGLVAASDDPAEVGSAFLVMERLEGETIPRRILRDPELAAVRSQLAGQCGAVLAALHAIDVGEVEGLERQDQVRQYRQVLDAMGLASPTFEIAFRWLEANRPPSAGDCVVHGDFRNGNLIITSEGIRAVLDWELVHRGDPLEDLGWLCVKSWRFGSTLPVGGFGTYDQLVAGYEAAGGRRVDPDALLWWEVLGNLKWGVMCMMQASAHTSGAVRSVELAAIGRRVCEVEWDLLSILPGMGLSGMGPPEPEPVVAGGSATPGPAPGRYLHGSPDAAGLVQAVREFLERDVMGVTDGRVRFHTRVAVNVLGMVEREMALGPLQARARERALAELGVAEGEAGLAAAIRSGRLDGGAPAVREVVAAGVRARLEVANPRYLEPPGPGEGKAGG